LKFIEHSKREPEGKRDLFYSILDTSVGTLIIASSDHGLVRILLPHEDDADSTARLQELYPVSTLVEHRERNQSVIDQLAEYFDGSRRTFSLPLEFRGTYFQRMVWKAVARVPFGQTRSYGEIAGEIGKPTACRAVGAANAANPIPIIIPCHRIIGSDGSMTGFGGGIPLKIKLLSMENSIIL
jgi:O-6-methylguanine DNA methyltransferase